MHKVLITGSRDWSPRELIAFDLRRLLEVHGPTKLLVIHGGAKGVDITAGLVAQHLGIHTARVDALWDSYHKAAGPIRNGVMLALDPDEALAYPRDLETSKGTANMIKLLSKAGVPTKITENK